MSIKNLHIPDINVLFKELEDTTVALELLGKLSKTQDTIITYNINVGLTLTDAVHKFKKRFIIANLVHTRCNITKAANILDIQRSHLSVLIRNLKINKNLIKEEMV